MQDKNVTQFHSYLDSFWDYLNTGRGVLGIVFPGCAETYETELQNPQEQRGGESHRRGGQSSVDRHQKLRRFNAGDILAIPAGVSTWTYNDGQEPIVSISLADNANEINQLDLVCLSQRYDSTLLQFQSFVYEVWKKINNTFQLVSNQNTN